MDLENLGQSKCSASVSTTLKTNTPSNLKFLTPIQAEKNGFFLYWSCIAPLIPSLFVHAILFQVLYLEIWENEFDKSDLPHILVFAPLKTHFPSAAV